MGRWVVTTAPGVWCRAPSHLFHRTLVIIAIIAIIAVSRSANSHHCHQLSACIITILVFYTLLHPEIHHSSPIHPSTYSLRCCIRLRRQYFFPAPQMMSLVDEAEDTFNATLNQGHEKSIFCKATKVRPDPTFFWTVGK